MKKVTRTLALLISICMILSCLSISVSADSVIGNITISPITEMNELNTRAAINTYFNQRKAFLTGAAQELPMANDPLERDETRHLTALTEVGLTVVDSTVAFGNIRCWNNYAEIDLTETITFSQNDTIVQEAVSHVILIRLGDNGNVVVESDGYYEVTTGFVSCCYINPEVAAMPAATAPGSRHCIVYVAEGEVGTTVNPDGTTKYGIEFTERKGSGDYSSLDWCAMFVVWCANHSNVSTNVIPFSSGCTEMKNWYTGNESFYASPAHYGTEEPQAGDQIFVNGEYDSPNHTGIITGVDSTYIYYVDGNNGGEVRNSKIRRSAANLIGYGRPAYESIGHTSSGSIVYNGNSTYHWNICSNCNNTFNSSAHTFKSYYTQASHWFLCTVCNYITSTSAHSPYWNYSSSQHWTVCLDCGYTTTKASHSLAWQSNYTQHWKECSTCRYTNSSGSHTYVESGPGLYTCSSCGYVTDVP